MRILIIKITSIGDILHTFPALTEAKAAYPEAQFDWVVAPEFAALLALHPAVHHEIPCPLRRWRKRYWQAYRQGEMRQFVTELRQQRYDLIIDAQSALKTGIISLLARGPVSGYDHRSVREYGTHWCYRHRYFVDKKQHAIVRLQQLFAKALHYPLSKETSYGINPHKFSAVDFPLPENYLIAIPNTTWPTKHWPMHQWEGLFQELEKQNIPVVIPFGNEHELVRANAWRDRFKNVRVLPKMNLRECAYVIAKAKAAVCVDTGLGHLAAAVNTPSVHLYGPTNPNLIGARGAHQVLLKGKLDCHPRCKRLCYYKKTSEKEASCLTQLAWQEVWQALRPYLAD